MKIAVFFLLTGALSLGIFLLGRKIAGEPPLILSFKVKATMLDGEEDSSKATKQFVGQIKNSISGKTGKYAVFVYRLNEKTGYGINENELMTAASIMKVPIAVAVHRAVDAGQIKLDDVYKLKEEDRRGGSGPIEYFEAGTEIPISELLFEMGKKSDNTAAAALTGIVGAQAVEQTVKDLGMVSSNFADNKTTARDVGAMWAKLWAEQIVSKQQWEIMQQEFSGSIYEERIPAGLPEGITVIHKVGTGESVWADAGIIAQGKNVQPLVMVILDENVDFDEAGDLVPNLAKMIWNYEESRGN